MTDRSNRVSKFNTLDTGKRLGPAAGSGAYSRK